MACEAVNYSAGYRVSREGGINSLTLQLYFFNLTDRLSRESILCRTGVFTQCKKFP